MKTRVILRLFAALSGALGAALYIVVARLSHDPATLIGIILGALGIVLTVVFWYVGERTADRAREAAYLAVAERVPARVPEEILRSTLPSSLLLPDRRITPLVDRRRELKALHDWYKDPSSPRFFVLEGPLGSGKTRLWMELASKHMDKGWRISRIRGGREADVVTALSQVESRHLLVIEVSHAGPELKLFLESIATDEKYRGWRTLLVCRSSLALPPLEPTAEAVMSECRRLPAGILLPPGALDDHARWRHEWAACFAETLGEAPSGLSWRAPRSGHPRIGRADPVGITVARSLADALGAQDGENDVFSTIARAELRAWLESDPGDGVPGSPGSSATRRAFAFAWLLRATSRDDLRLAVRVSSDFGRDANHENDLANRLMRLYPGIEDSFALPPDAISAAIAIPELLHDPERAIAELATLPAERMATAVAQLIAAGADHRVHELVDATLASAQVPLDMAMLSTIGAAVTNSSIQEQILESLLTTHPPADPALAEKMALRFADRGLWRAAATASSVAVHLYRTFAADTPESFNSDLARALDTYANFRSQTDERGEETLVAAAEAVSLFRALATENPEPHTANLGHSLANLANFLAQAGRRSGDVLGAATEAVTVFRKLANEKPEIHTLDLAHALGNYANQLGLVGGDRDDVLIAAEESLTLFRTLASDNADPRTSELARALSNYADMLAHAGGRGEDALRAAEESVKLFRTLAIDKLDANTPGFAYALDTYANCLTELNGRSEDALRAAEESVRLFRAIAAEQSDTDTRDLARALDTYADQLARLGARSADALRAAEESVGLYRMLAANKADLDTRNLAHALNTYASSLTSVNGRSTDALRAAEESVGLYRVLATNNADLGRPGLPYALQTYASCLANVSGRGQDALRAAEESLELVRALATDNPDLHTPNLARAIHNYAAILFDAGDFPSVLRLSVEMFRASIRVKGSEGIRRTLTSMALNDASLALSLLGRQAEADAISAGLLSPEALELDGT